MSLKNGSGTTDVETGKPQDPRQDRHPGEGNLAKDSQQMQQQGKRGQDEGKQMGGTKGSSQQQGGHGDQQSQQDRDSRQGFEQGRQAGQANFTGSPSGNQPHQPKSNKQQSQQGGSQGGNQYGEGNFVAGSTGARVVLTYRDNINGSDHAAAGVANEVGNVVGVMPHPERASADWLGSADGNLLLGSFLQAAA